MLTSDLLVTRRYKGKIEPVYAEINEDNLQIAEAVIAAFKRNVGKTYGELIDETKSLEDVNYRLIRGLVQLLERRCVIEEDSIVEPAIARKTVFEACNGLVIGTEEREKTIMQAAKKLSILPEELENALWADYEENMIIKEFEEISAESLLRQYNLSLTQTLMFKAIGMEIQTEENFQNIFRKIKQLGLVYSIEGNKIYLDGPASLFRLTERYGISLAKLLPTIIQSGKWCLKAGILKKTPDGKRILEFYLDNSRQLFNTEKSCEKTFDSAIEKEFYHHSFDGWTTRREPTVLKAGTYAFIPDFSMERTGAKVYVEIIGFWTPEYLKKKIQKVNMLKEKLILIVNKNLACSGSEFRTKDVIFYNKKIPYAELARILKSYEERQLADEIVRLEDFEVPVNGSVVNLQEIAKNQGISVDALREIAKQKPVKDYILFGNQLVNRGIVNAIRDELMRVGAYTQAIRIFEKYGIKAHTELLEYVGYKVKWSGIDPGKAMIVKVLSVNKVE